MKLSGANVHGTAIIAGTRGILFVGPSGRGKTSLAFTCMEEALAAGKFAALIADDRVDIRTCDSHVIASRPETIRDLMELRYGGIVSRKSQAKAVIHCGALIVDPVSAERLPPENETLVFDGGADVPLLRIPSQTPRPLAFLDALMRTRSGAQRPTGETF
ncbi:HPr kinase/phosphorylase [Agrobacterium sp. ES01]|uniref:HPr kinase/phosphorylase n=1 Tax=Agrobacterium sp. ES01 TaxID=3420714 RepID=UPI003D13C15E